MRICKEYRETLYPGKVYPFMGRIANFPDGQLHCSKELEGAGEESALGQAVVADAVTGRVDPNTPARRVTFSPNLFQSA